MTEGKSRTTCPFFQGNDERCARRFNLQSLRTVFSQCLDQYDGCSVYQRLCIDPAIRNKPGCDDCNT